VGNPPHFEGRDEVVEWFGRWPSFHDAEVLSIELDRRTGTRVEIYAFERAPEVDSTGHYGISRHAVVTFTLNGFPMDADGVVNTRIEYFNHQNVLFGVAVESLPGGYALALDGVFGVSAYICGETISVSLRPGRTPSTCT
jgi:hypothetical protein